MTYNLIWDNTTNTATTALGNQTGLKQYRGETFLTGSSVVGKVVNQVKVMLAKYQSTPITETFYLKVVKADFTEIEIGSLDASTLSTVQPTFVEYTFTNDENDYVMQNGDMICLNWSYSASALYLACQYSSNDPANSTYAQNVNGTWTTDITGQSQPMQVYELEVASSGPRDPPPPFNLESL